MFGKYSQVELLSTCQFQFSKMVRVQSTSLDYFGKMFSFSLISEVVPTSLNVLCLFGKTLYLVSFMELDYGRTEDVVVVFIPVLTSFVCSELTYLDPLLLEASWKSIFDGSPNCPGLRPGT